MRFSGGHWISTAQCARLMISPRFSEPLELKGGHQSQDSLIQETNIRFHFTSRGTGGKSVNSVVSGRTTGSFHRAERPCEMDITTCICKNDFPQ
jgi:hypothetical protein